MQPGKRSPYSAYYRGRKRFRRICSALREVFRGTELSCCCRKLAKASDLEERAGYYGERIALTAQMLGLNTCWAAMTVSKREVKKHIKIGRGEKLVIVLALGYGKTQGRAHKSKEMEKLCTGADRPLWFENGMKAVMLAPTAMNQQKFLLSRRGNKVTAESLGGFY